MGRTAAAIKRHHGATEFNISNNLFFMVGGQSRFNRDDIPRPWETHQKQGGGMRRGNGGLEVRRGGRL